MRGHVNDCLRSIICWTVRLLGCISGGLHHLKIRTFRFNQRRLKRKYDITCDTPVLSYGPEVAESIRVNATKAGRGAKFATTSGSTGKPKELLYTKRRLLTLKLIFSDMFMRACYAFKIKRTSLYVFGSFETDTSLTSVLLDERQLPSYTSTLQAPYRVQQYPAIRELVAKYGSAAVRLWILAISNPGVLYSTNPSTISTFIDEVTHDWQHSSQLIRDWYHNPNSFAHDIHKIAHRLESRDCASRLKQIATSNGPLRLWQCAPAVAAYMCWTGGYVKPFLDRLAKHLPSPRYRLIPMYSMSTETIETLPYFRSDDIAFLPIAPGVAYEFVDDTGKLLEPHELETGKLYAMVVSDPYGLRRYQTEDLFVCERKVAGLPDLRFVRRRTLAYSFTGEKLTAEQLSEVFEQLYAKYPSLVGESFLTCVPCSRAFPHYTVLLIGDTHGTQNHLLASKCDELISEINCEYKSKRASNRLGPIEVANIGIKEFVAANSNWDAQFKLEPLTGLPR